MNHKNTTVDVYFTEGCGRCALARTPACTVHTWHAELEILRSIILETGLTEERKWGVPCYTFEGKNVLLLGSFKESCVVSFLKGVLLQDAHHILIKQGENSTEWRVVRFKSVEEIAQVRIILKEYIFEAIEVERAGLKIEKDERLALPEELEKEFTENPALQTAFEALTKGRQRGYVLYFSAPKQSKTRQARIQKCIPLILKGKGIHD